MTTLPAWLTAPLARRRAHRDYQPRHRPATVQIVPLAWSPYPDATLAALRGHTREQLQVRQAPDGAPPS